MSIFKRKNGKLFLIEPCAAIDFITLFCVCGWHYYTIESLTVLKKQLNCWALKRVFNSKEFSAMF